MVSVQSVKFGASVYTSFTVAVNDVSEKSFRLSNALDANDYLALHPPRGIP